MQNTEIFDPNSPTVDEPTSELAPLFPLLGMGVYSAQDYADRFTQVVDNVNSSPYSFIKALSKAGLAQAPEIVSYAHVSRLPDPTGEVGKIIDWPGLPASAILRLSREHVAPKVIIGLRCDDVQRYAQLSKHPWKPGWGVVLKEAMKSPTSQENKDIEEAEIFLQNCNLVTDGKVITRDARGYCDFSTFLGLISRDSLTFDNIAVWTDRLEDGSVRAFKAMPASSIKRTNGGYNGDTSIFAVAVDEMNRVQMTFTRKQLVLAIRNPRTDSDVFGYGWPELEMAFPIIQGFTNALELNLDTFNKNSTPHGILLATGNWMQKQLDVLSRIWANIKRGTSKTHALPAIAVPKDGKLELLDLTRLKGNDVYYKDFMNMLAGLLCALYRFPVSRIGYKISGGGSDNQENPAMSSGTIVDEDDPGRAPFLNHIENFINEYLMSRWPHLVFRFWGKNPKEDAREYEARMNGMTYKERRQMSDLPDLTGSSPELKKAIEIMNLCPTDPGLTGVYQAAIAIAYAQETAEAGASAKQEGATFPAKKDPAKSEAHGHTSGVRRDSAAEKAD